VWEQPEKFDPQRFSPERVSARPKGAYFPFWSGPHQCIGSEFAMLEMQLIVPMMLREFQLELPPGPPAVPKAAIALRPAEPIRLIPRSVKRLSV
jgi:cytochrome P450